MNTANNRAFFFTCLLLLAAGIALFFVEFSTRINSQEHENERLVQLKKLGVLHNSLNQKVFDDVSFDFFQFARESGLLVDHPLAFDQSRESYCLAEKADNQFPVIVENENVNASRRYGFYADGRVDVFWEVGGTSLCSSVYRANGRGRATESNAEDTDDQ